MRSKTDESDARFRKLEAELAQNLEELAALQTNARAPAAGTGGAGAGGAGEKELTSQLRVLEEEAETLLLEKGRLNEHLGQTMAGGGVDRVRAELTRKESVIKDLRTRAENQAEYIRTMTARIEQSDQSSARVSALQQQMRELEERSQAQSTALKQQMDQILRKRTAATEARQRHAALAQELEQSQTQAMDLRQQISAQAHILTSALDSGFI